MITIVKFGWNWTKTGRSNLLKILTSKALQSAPIPSELIESDMKGYPTYAVPVTTSPNLLCAWREVPFLNGFTSNKQEARGPGSGLGSATGALTGLEKLHKNKA